MNIINMSVEPNCICQCILLSVNFLSLRILCLHAVVVIYCPDLDGPGNGTKNTNETSCGTTAQFSCDRCYELKGYEQLSCLPNGKWSGEEPNCSC